MSLVFRAMRPEEADAVADMVRGLARDTGASLVPKLTGESLRANGELIEVTVAEEEGALLGACLTLMTFSTWRNAKGLYVVDLFINGTRRNRQIGLMLLKEATRRGHAKGALFIKLEVDVTNEGAARFYERLGFVRKAEDRLFVLEEAGLARLLAD